MTTFPVPPPVTVKLLELVPVPPAVVTLIVPVVAPLGTVAVICVSEFTVKDEASVPVDLANEAPVKWPPVMTALVPTGPLVGEKLVMEGEGGILPPASLLARNTEAMAGSSAEKNV